MVRVGANGTLHLNGFSISNQRRLDVSALISLGHMTQNDYINIDNPQHKVVDHQTTSDLNYQCIPRLNEYLVKVSVKR